MQAYTETPAGNKPVESSAPAEAFTLHRQQPRTKGDLPAWVTHALAGVKPWTWDLRARLGRTWERNPNHDSGAHARERRAREERARANLKRLPKITGVLAAQRLPGALGLRARAVLHELRRLIDDGDWWKARSYEDRRTGEVKETLYLPEDTWSAETALDWCLTRLLRLVGAARGMTEKVTPRSTVVRPLNSSGWRKEAFRGQDDAPWVRIGKRWGEGGQPDLPATT